MSVQENITRLEELLKVAPCVEVLEHVVDNTIKEYSIIFKKNTYSADNRIKITFEHGPCIGPKVLRVSWGPSQDLFSRSSLDLLPFEKHDRLFEVVSSIHERYLEKERPKALGIIEGFKSNSVA